MRTYIVASGHVDSLTSSKATLRHDGDYILLGNPFDNLKTTFYIFGQERFRKSLSKKRTGFETYIDKTLELGPGQTHKVTVTEGREIKLGRDYHWDRDIDVYLQSYSDIDTGAEVTVRTPPALTDDALDEEGSGGWMILIAIAVIVIFILIIMSKK